MARRVISLDEKIRKAEAAVAAAKAKYDAALDELENYNWIIRISITA
jgi:multidrug resistance efflux pump